MLIQRLYKNIRYFIGILFLIYISINKVNAINCPDGFEYDEIRNLCISADNPSVIAYPEHEKRLCYFKLCSWIDK